MKPATATTEDTEMQKIAKFTTNNLSEELKQPNDYFEFLERQAASEITRILEKLEIVTRKNNKFFELYIDVKVTGVSDWAFLKSFDVEVKIKDRN